MRLFRDPQVVLTILCGVALLLSFFDLHPWLPYAAVLFGSYFALRSAWESLRERSIDVNFLMVIAAVGAVAVGRPIDAAALLFLFSLSSTLESLAMSRTRSAIEGLVKLRPDQAVRVSDIGEEKVRVEELRIGDHVKVPPFEAIPVDGTVVEGSSAVDQSAMTGESVPVRRQPGERLIAGTRNLEGTLVMEVASTVGDSTLDKIVDLVRDAQENKASGERISSWFGQRYTFFVIGAFALSLGIRLALGLPTYDSLYASLTLLVALSPCALVISTPATTLSALAWAARNGMLVRGGEYIETAGKVDAIALDKTGTLTVGQPRLVEICVCAGSAVLAGGGKVNCTEEEACWRHGGELSPTARDLLAAAAAAEGYSTHPVAQAIHTAARELNVEVPLADEQTASPGLGVSANVKGKAVHLGQQRYLEEVGVPLPREFLEHIGHLQAEGMTITLLSYGGQLAALGLMDQPRAEATAFLSTLKQLGVKDVVMLTGDTRTAASAVAEQLSITHFKAELLPHQKTEHVEQLVKEGRTVMMLGDGINDAPSLAKASLGVAMGGLGSDIALNAADVVLMHDRLDRVPELIKLGRKTNSIIRANLLFASGVIVILTLLSLFVKLPLPIAVVGHEGSTVLVILNGLRVLRGP